MNVLKGREVGTILEFGKISASEDVDVNVESRMSPWMNLTGNVAGSERKNLCPRSHNPTSHTKIQSSSTRTEM